MKQIFDFAGSVISLIDYLYVLFFVPIGQIPAVYLEMFTAGSSDPLADSLVQLCSFLGEYLSRLMPWMLDISLGSALFGAGLGLFLLWRFLQFLIPILEAL